MANATLNDGLFDHLAAGTALIAALGGTAIYRDVIPLAAALPAVVYSVNAGGDTNDTPTRNLDVRYLVKAVAIDSRDAETLADLIDDRLHEASVALDAPWTAYRCQRTQIVSYMEQEPDGEQYFHHGGLYRIRASR